MSSSFKFILILKILTLNFLYSQPNSFQDFSRDEFIEKFEDVIHRSLDHQQTNEKLVNIYFLSRDALVTAVKSKNNIKKALQKIARDKRAGAYQLVESKTNLNTAEKEEYFLNKLAPDNFIVLMLENGEEELRFYHCIYEK